MSETLTQNDNCSTNSVCSSHRIDATQTDREVILIVPKDIASLSLGFVLDCGKKHDYFRFDISFLKIRFSG